MKKVLIVLAVIVAVIVCIEMYASYEIDRLCSEEYSNALQYNQCVGMLNNPETYR